MLSYHMDKLQAPNSVKFHCDVKFDFEGQSQYVPKE